MLFTSVSALLTIMFVSRFSPSTALSLRVHNLRQFGYKIRFAKPDDVKLMDACNRAVLPENYSADFYEQHMKCWPELTFIALTENNEMIGYSMGRLEEISAPVLPAMKYASPPEHCGHVASIAVLPQYRGQGVARQMMNRLHHNMAQYYNMDCVNLFCRASNADALRLYQEKLNYRIERTVSSYYLDREDGHFLLREGLLEQWQAARDAEPLLVGADELHFEVGSTATSTATTRKTTETLLNSVMLRSAQDFLPGSNAL